MTEAEFVPLLASSPALWLELLTKLDGPTKLEPYQINFLNDLSAFRLVNKARQIGFSTVIAAEGLHAAATRPRYTANYISVTQDEAKDKINIAKNLYHSIPDDLKKLGLKPEIWNDAEDTLGFHGPPNTSLLISKPASSGIRGGKKDIYFDEAAHIAKFKQLYQAGLPAIIRGAGRITVVSTPMDESGLFYDIATDEKNYPEYTRHVVPWWESSTMVKPGYELEALAEAPTLGTPDRVHRYGSEKLLAVYRSSGAESGDFMAFQTEFECQFVDELAAFYPWELITDAASDSEVFFGDRIPDNWVPEGQLFIGVDLAKERDQSVFLVVEAVEAPEDKMVHHHVRFIHATQDNYSDQEDYLRRLIRRLKPSRVSIDKTGVGNVLFERLNHEANTEGVVFTAAKKEGWATKFKGELQLGTIHYPRHPELMKQIHSIRRVKTEGGLYKFSGKKDDYFWALMLALYGEGRQPVRFSLLGR